jgi:hypothetical protein
MRLILAVLFVFITLPSFGQNFNLDQLISLTKRDSAAVTSYIAEKDWVLNESKLPAGNQAGRLIYKHSPLEQSGNFAQFWLVYYYKNNKCLGLSYSTLDTKTYEALKNQITNKNMRRISVANTKTGSLSKYKWGNYTVSLELKKQNLDQDNKPIKSYELTIDTI